MPVFWITFAGTVKRSCIEKKAIAAFFAPMEIKSALPARKNWPGKNGNTAFLDAVMETNLREYVLRSYLRQSLHR